MVLTKALLTRGSCPGPPSPHRVLDLPPQSTSVPVHRGCHFRLYVTFRLVVTDTGYPLTFKTHKPRIILVVEDEFWVRWSPIVVD